MDQDSCPCPWLSPQYVNIKIRPDPHGLPLKNYPEEILEIEVDPTEPMNISGSQFVSQVSIEDISPETENSNVENKVSNKEYLMSKYLIHNTSILLRFPSVLTVNQTMK